MMRLLHVANVLYKRVPWAMIVVALGVIIGGGGLPVAAETFITAGRGKVTTVLPTGRQQPQRIIYRTEALTGPMPTNAWWSSAAWLPLSDNMYAHPMVLRATAAGLGISYPPVTVKHGSNPGFFANYRQDLLLSMDGLQVSEALVSDYDDWTVTLQFAHDGMQLQTTFGHGFPYVYASFHGGRPAVVLSGLPSVWQTAEAAVGLTVNGRHYGLFCSDGGHWQQQGPYRWRCVGDEAAGHVAIAALPAANGETLAYFHRHAFVFPGSSTVSWRYDESSGTVYTGFTVTPDVKQGDSRDVLMALYPHQWQHTTAPLTHYTYDSPRGPMKLMRGNVMETAHTYSGVLPYLPALPSDDTEPLRRHMTTTMQAADLWPIGLGTGEHDTYWMGKNLNRVAQLLPIAAQLGEDAWHERLLSELKQHLEHWLSADAVRTGQLLFYDKLWGTLIGFPASHGTVTELNDHHFHYGYFINAAAMVALYDPQWAAPEAWGDAVRLLIRDWAGSDRDDALFPFLRTFDAYAGHSWASGTGAMREGNNQESSSEAIHAWAGVILFGAATGDTALRDLGIWGYTLETTAARSYWLDTTGTLFPSAYPERVIGRLYGSGGDYDTWWTRAAGAVHAINMLPMTGASLYLGYEPEALLLGYEQLGGATYDGEFADIIHMAAALADAQQAIAGWDAQRPSEFGASHAHTYHWLRNMEALGRPAADVTADTPLAVVFRRGSETTYVAYNGGDDPLQVTFSDGTQLTAGGRDVAVRTVTGF